MHFVRPTPQALLPAFSWQENNIIVAQNTRTNVVSADATRVTLMLSAPGATNVAFSTGALSDNDEGVSLDNDGNTNLIFTFAEVGGIVTASWNAYQVAFPTVNVHVIEVFFRPSPGMLRLLEKMPDSFPPPVDQGQKLIEQFLDNQLRWLGVLKELAEQRDKDKSNVRSI